MPAEAKYAFAGLVVGALIGVSGMGGGSVMTPLLIALGLPVEKAIGTDLVYAAATKIVASYRHLRARRVEWRIVNALALGSIPGAFIGVFTKHPLKHAMGTNGDEALRTILGIALLTVACFIAWSVWKRPHGPKLGQPLRWPTRKRVITPLIGVVGGFGVGLTSLGSGTLFALVLLTWFPLTANRVVGTDVVHATIVVIAAAIGSTLSGDVVFSSVLWLAVGSIPGVLAGSQLTGILPERLLRGGLAAVLTLSGVLLLSA